MDRIDPYKNPHEKQPLLINPIDDADVPQKEAKKTTTIGAYFTFVNGFIGGGLLGLPYGFKNGGLFACAIGLLILALISNWTVRLLGKCKMEYQDENGRRPIKTYSDIGKVTFGTAGGILVNTSVVISQIGYCCAYMVFIATNLSELTFTPGWMTRFHVTLMVLPILILFCFLRNMRYLSPTSIFANIAVICAVVAVLEYGFQNKGIQSLSHYEPYWIRPSTFPIFYGIVAFGYTIHGLALDIQSSMRDPQKYDLVVNTSMGFVTTIYMVFGTLGYLFFGDSTNSVITLDLSPGIINDIIKLSLSIVLIFAFPLQMFPVIQIMERGVLGNGLKNNIFDTIVRDVMRTLLVILAIILALAVPLFGDFSALVGTFSNSFIAFIFPPIAYWRLFAPQGISIWMKILCVFVVLVGLVGLFVGSSLILQQIIYDLSHHIYNS